MFIDPDPAQVEASKNVDADIVELHTGDYCAGLHEFDSVKAFEAHQHRELERLQDAAAHASSLGLMVAAGHGLDYKNVHAVAAIPQIEEFNIGHSIIARAVFVGLDRAVREMIEALEKGRHYGR
jgi:pyridoxine 5-phosphate synthase